MSNGFNFQRDEVTGSYDVGIGSLVVLRPVAMGKGEFKRSDRVPVDGSRERHQDLIAVVTGATKTTITVSGNRELYSMAEGNSTRTLHFAIEERVRGGGKTGWGSTPFVWSDRDSYCPDDALWGRADHPGGSYKVARMSRDFAEVHGSSDRRGPDHWPRHWANVDVPFVVGFLTALAAVKPRHEVARKTIREVARQVEHAPLFKEVHHLLMTASNQVGLGHHHHPETDEEAKSREALDAKWQAKRDEEAKAALLAD